MRISGINEGIKKNKIIITISFKTEIRGKHLKDPKNSNITQENGRATKC